MYVHTYVPADVHGSMPQHTCDIAECRENKGRYVYVNRGFGFHAYSGRVGIMPEITVIELKKGNKLV